MTQGFFITFEGGEGAGKSTQITRLAVWLREEKGREVLALREPGGTPAGDQIRRLLLSTDTGALDPVTELLLFSAARRELVTTVIEPALARGGVVLCDRFADSTIVYQGYGRGVDRALIDRMIEAACGPLWPRKTFLLDLPVADGVARSRARLAGEESNEGRFEEEELSFHEKVRAGYRELARKEPGRFIVIDAMKTVDEVALEIREKVAACL